MLLTLGYIDAFCLGHLTTLPIAPILKFDATKYEEVNRICREHKTEQMNIIHTEHVHFLSISSQPGPSAHVHVIAEDAPIFRGAPHPFAVAGGGAKARPTR